MTRDSLNPVLLPAGLKLPSPGENLYDLLELRPFESDERKISARVRELIKTARKYQVGPYARQAGLRLEALSAAMTCLLDPPQKLAYDEKLRNDFGLPPVVITSTYQPQNTPEWAPAGRPRGRKRTLLALICLAAVIGWLSAGWLDSEDRSPVRSNEQGVTAPPVVPAPKVPVAPTPAAVSSSGPGATAHVPRIAPVTPPPPRPSAPSIVAVVEGAALERAAPLENSASQHGSAGDAASAVPDAAPSSPALGETPSQSAPPVALARSVPLRERPPITPSSRGLQLTTVEVLRELRTLRTHRTPAARLAADPSQLGHDRILELVRYGRSQFPRDVRFQRQLYQEVVALQKAFPQLRPALERPSP